MQDKWKKVVNRSLERIRTLDYGYKEAMELHDAWNFMIVWLDDRMIRLEEFQKELGEEQLMYDPITDKDKDLIGEEPKAAEPITKNMMLKLKNNCATYMLKDNGNLKKHSSFQSSLRMASKRS